jgi:hypothetical protein
MPTAPVSARAMFWISVYSAARIRLSAEGMPIEKLHEAARDEAGEALERVEADGILDKLV